MALRTEGLDEQITQSAKQEFMTYGFKDASVNRIAKNAGVTSGAIYIRYTDKDDIFKSLVDTAIKGLDDKIQFYTDKYSQLAVSQSWDQLFRLDKEVFDWSIEYMYENLDAFKLLVCKSEGSSVSDFASGLILFKFQRTFDFTEAIRKTFEDNGKSKIKLPICKEELALLSSAQYHSLFEVIRKDYSKEDARKYLLTIQQIYFCGLKVVMKDFFEETECEAKTP